MRQHPSEIYSGLKPSCCRRYCRTQELMRIYLSQSEVLSLWPLSHRCLFSLEWCSIKRKRLVVNYRERDKHENFLPILLCNSDNRAGIGGTQPWPVYLQSSTEWLSPPRHLLPHPSLIVSVSEVAWLRFDVQTLSSSQKTLTAGAERGRWAATGCCRPDVSLLLSSAPVQSALATQAVAEHLWNRGVCTIVMTVNDYLQSSKAALITQPRVHTGGVPAVVPCVSPTCFISKTKWGHK